MHQPKMRRSTKRVEICIVLQNWNGSSFPRNTVPGESKAAYEAIEEAKGKWAKVKMTSNKSNTLPFFFFFFRPGRQSPVLETALKKETGKRVVKSLPKCRECPCCANLKKGFKPRAQTPQRNRPLFRIISSDACTYLRKWLQTWDFR